MVTTKRTGGKMMSSLFQMKRTVLIVFSLLLLLSTSLWAQFPEGFESGAIPATWTVHNVDGDTNQFIAYNAGTNAYDGSWVARVSWNAAGNNDWLVTPALSITSLAKTVKFWARSTSDYYSESFNIKLSTTGTAVDNFTISLGSFQDIPNAWTEYIVDLEDYIGDTVHLAVQCVSVDELAFHVDGFDWVLGDDLSGYAISGSTAPTVNTVNDYVVTVKNNGGNSQSTYTVKFLVDEVEVATQAGTTLAPGATADFTFAWTPTAVQNYELQGQVILANDGNTNNDYTDILTAVVQPAGTAAVTVGDINTTTSSNSYPINFYWKNSLSQTIYMSEELNIGGNITLYKYHANLAGDITGTKPLKVWMANTAETTFESNTAWLPISEFTLVFDGTIDFTGLTGSTEISIPLEIPFAYGGGNLCVMVQRPLDSAYYLSSNTWKNTATSEYPNRTIYYYSDSVAADPTTPPTASARVASVPNTTFMLVTGGLATLTGNVTSNGNPVAGATVAIDGTTRSTITDADGDYTINYLNPGTVSVTTSKHGYIDTNTTGVVLEADETTELDIVINQLPTVTVSGQINGSDTSAGLAEAIVKITGYEDYETETNATGAYTIAGVYSGHTYELKVTRPGYQAYTQEIEVGATDLTVPVITLNELANPPSGVVATPSATAVELVWNAPGDGVDVWFTHALMEEYYDAIGTGGSAQFEVAHRYSPAQLEAFGVAGASLTKVQFMPNEPSASYGIKIYTGGSASGPGPLVHSQSVASVVVEEWNEVELTDPVDIPYDAELWIAIDINTPTGYPAGCDDGPAVLNYGDMMYFQGAWANLDDLAGIDANWMIKGMAAGATGPRTFTINTGVQTPSEDAFLAKRSSKPAPFAKASENGHVPTRTSTPTENKPVFTQTTNTRAITGYNVWRTPVASTGNEDAWTQLATALTVTEYTDETWAQVETGEFKYVVKAIYTGGVASNPAFSNTVFKNMTAAVNISLATADGASPAGAVVTLTNTDGNPDHVYTQTANSANVIFPQVWHGIYSIKVVKAGYQTVIQDNVIIAGDSYTHPTITLPVSAIFLSEGFEGAFPPAGWTILDSDGDGHNWMQWDYTPHIGTYSAASGSYDNNFGQLYPDNWLITPQLNLNPGTTNTMTFWVAPQDASYPQDHYSVMVSTTNNQPASFTSIYSETITGSDWEERTVNLPYAGQDIYIAFRHHDCTDWYIMKIDDIEIASTESADELTPIVKPTALHGNYPNPFNPTTTISYDLANDGNVAIDIYNIKGQKVKTLVNDRQNAGAHTVVWNGHDDNGKHVGSGIYFFNMKAGKYTSTRKMILMK